MTIFVNGIFPGKLEPSTTVGANIDIFENAWPDPERTIAMVEQECSNPDRNVYWEKAHTIGSGAYQNIRTNQMLSVTHLAHITGNPVLQNIHNQFYLLLLAASIPYSQRYGIDCSLHHEGYSLLKYSNNEQYKSHYDGTAASKRIISALAYLNDDFEGGELEFTNFGIKIKPQAGMLILFPSNFTYSHVAHPVTKGTKYAMVTWIQELNGN